MCDGKADEQKQATHNAKLIKIFVHHPNKICCFTDLWTICYIGLEFGTVLRCITKLYYFVFCRFLMSSIFLYIVVMLAYCLLPDCICLRPCHEPGPAAPRLRCARWRCVTAKQMSSKKTMRIVESTSWP